MNFIEYLRIYSETAWRIMSGASTQTTKIQNTDFGFDYPDHSDIGMC